MAAKNASLGTPGHPTKDAPTRRGRDLREEAQENGTQAQYENPPDHGLPTFGPSRFLWEVPSGTPLDELGDLYDRWRDDTQQVTFEEVGADE